MADRQWVVEQLRQVDGAAGLIDTLRVGFACVPCEDPSTSHLGGWPTLAGQVPWPSWVHPELGPRHLDMFAHIDLTDIVQIPGSTLTGWPTGSLSFFADYSEESHSVGGLDPDDAGCSAVLFTPASSGVERRDHRVHPNLRPAFLQLTPQWVWQLPINVDDDLDEDALDDIERAYRQRLFGTDDVVTHLLVGYGNGVQGSIEFDAACAVNGCYLDDDEDEDDDELWSLAEQQASDWQLLLSIDDANEDVLDSANTGTLSWLARKCDLQHRDLTHPWWLYQPG